MSRLFTGDYSTGSFGQWDSMLTTEFVGDTPDYPTRALYSATIVPLGDCGYAARYELRAGDTIPELSSERCEAVADASTSASPSGATRWYAFSLKFDETWHEDQSSIAPMVLAQFRDEIEGPISPTVAFGWGVANAPGQESGYWYLRWGPQSAAGVGINTYSQPIAALPLNPGSWHDIKMRVVWSSDDEVGSIQLWHNGERQTFTSYGGGGITFTGRTLCPGATGVKIHQGIYRQASEENGTCIVYHNGFRVADSEESL